MADRCTLGFVPNGRCHLSFGLASNEVGAKRLSQSPEQGRTPASWQRLLDGEQTNLSASTPSAG